jgi:prepilin-type processing-associated H-X9-DG protein
MHQLALAMHNYVSTNTALPPMMIWTLPNGPGWSLHTRLLPFMEENNTYNDCNFMVGERWGGGNGACVMSGYNGSGSTEAGTVWGLMSMTASCKTIQSFLCPSDTGQGSYGAMVFYPGGPPHLIGRLNYPFNIGNNPWTIGSKSNGQLNGPAYFPNYAADLSAIGSASNVGGFSGLSTQAPISINSFSDGTNQTAIFSEWIKGPGTAPPWTDGLGVVYTSPDVPNAFAGQVFPNPDQPMDYQYAQDCGATTVQNWSWKGDWWVSGQSSGYSHTQLPNRKSCYYATLPNQPTQAAFNMLAASSYHSGGVNVAFMDGSCRFIKSVISPQLWYGIATPSGKESIDPAGF